MESLVSYYNKTFYGLSDNYRVSQ